MNPSWWCFQALKGMFDDGALSTAFICCDVCKLTWENKSLSDMQAVVATQQHMKAPFSYARGEITLDDQSGKTN